MAGDQHRFTPRRALNQFTQTGLGSCEADSGGFHAVILTSFLVQCQCAEALVQPAIHHCISRNEPAQLLGQPVLQSGQTRHVGVDAV